MLRTFFLTTGKILPQLIPVLGLCISVAGAGAIGWQIWQSQQQYQETRQLINQITQNQSLASSQPVSTAIVSIVGAVVHPQVVSLPLGSRIADAIEAAGGIATSSAAQTYFLGLNLAEKVTDGQQIHVPFAETEQSRSVSIISSTGSASSTTKMNLNSASAKELDTLPGLGETRVQKLIDLRPFTSWEDLKSKLSLPESVVNNLKKTANIY